MIPVVIDTNVILSALLFAGTPERLIPLWKSGKIQPHVSKEIVAELLRILSYPKFDLTETEIQYLLYVELLPFCDVVPVTTGPVIVTEDPSDDIFCYCCKVAGARAIISGDKHLSALKSYGKAPILTPSQFLKKFRDELSS